MLIAAALALGDLQITNFKAGELVRYPVVILRGVTAAQDVAAGLTWKSMNRYEVAGGKFVAPIELKPGVNMVLLTSGDDVLKFRLDYRPMTNPRTVACAYIAPKDGPTDYDAPSNADPTLYGEHIDAAMKLLQGFAAEAMNDAGFGRKTFGLEFDSKGKVLVHVIRSDRPATELRGMTGPNLLSTFEIDLMRQFPPDKQKTCAFLSFSRYDRGTRRVVGACDESGGSIAMLDSLGFDVWPVQPWQAAPVFEGSGWLDLRELPDLSGRGSVWGSAAATMGDVLKQLGHTFGLSDSGDSQSVMGDGFRNINRAFTIYEPPTRMKPDNYYFNPDEVPHWDPASASALNDSPWFAPDGP